MPRKHKTKAYSRPRGKDGSMPSFNRTSGGPRVMEPVVDPELARRQIDAARREHGPRVRRSDLSDEMWDRLQQCLALLQATTTVVNQGDSA